MWLCFAVALSLRVAWVLLVPNAQYSDSVWYDAAAARLVSVGEYGVDGPSAWFPPGYPLFLALVYKAVGPSQLAGKLANAALGAATSALVCWLGRTCCDARVGLLAGLLVACWPNLIFHTGILSSDLLAAFWFVVLLWLAMRLPQRNIRLLPWLTLMGFLFGWALLTRPLSLILLPSMSFIFWRQSRSALRSALRLLPVVVAAGVIVGGWTLRNYLKFGEVILIATNGGYNFWQANQPYANGNDTFWSETLLELPEYRTMWYGDELTKYREGTRLALAYLAENPLHPLAALPLKVFWLYHTDTSGFYEGLLYAPMLRPSPVADWLKTHFLPLKLATQAYYGVALLCAIASVVLIRAGERWQMLPFVALPVLLPLFHLFFHAKDRFHVPVLPFVALLAAVGIERALTLNQVNRKQTRGAGTSRRT